MSLSEELAALKARGAPKTTKCNTCRWLNTQTDTVRRQLGELILDSPVPVKRVHDLLVKHGLPVKVSAFRDHVNECMKHSATSARNEAGS